MDDFLLGVGAGGALLGLLAFYLARDNDELRQQLAGLRDEPPDDGGELEMDDGLDEAEADNLVVDYLEGHIDENRLYAELSTNGSELARRVRLLCMESLPAEEFRRRLIQTVREAR